MPPLVSVIVPAYNAGRYIRATLDSLSEQTFEDFEVLVVDDCSADDTADVVLAHPDKRIRLIRQEKNGGVAQARNTAIAASTGKFIAILDSDDIATKERLARQVLALESDPAMGMVGSHVRIIRDDGTVTDKVWKRPTRPDEASLQLIFRNTLATSMMFRRDAVPDGMFKKMPVAEDYDFNVRFAANAKISNIDEVLTLYRVRETGLTHSKQTLMESHVREIMREQIEALGIRPTDYQLDLNRHVGAYTLQSSKALLRDVEDWLSVLQDANQRVRRFDPDAFDRVLAMEWFGVCDFGAAIGPQALHIWRRSKFAKIWLPPLPRLARFFVKCQLRKGRPGGDVVGRLA